MKDGRYVTVSRNVENGFDKNEAR